MAGRVDNAPSLWMEESQELPSAHMKMKRKFRPKRMEFVGWGSKPLIEFLDSIGKDTSKQISQYDVAAIINDYVNTHNLIHPQKRKRILCDERLHSLFGKKSLVRIKVYDLLETHFTENQDESKDDFLYSSEENDENTAMDSKLQKASNSERKTLNQSKKVPETPKSCFAAIISANMKLLYLRRSLVLDLLKDPQSFEDKVVGSFVRVKSDPHDYFQKNSHQLLQVTGVTKASDSDTVCAESLLRVSSMMKDIRICMLSDDNFSEDECEDLRQRVKSGSLKRPNVVELQQKAEMLHRDITKHWLVRELSLLQNLIDQANEKGWRKELFEYLERKQLLQTPAEQSKLLLEVPKVIADEIEQEAVLQEGRNGSPRLIRRGPSEISTNDLESNKTSSSENIGGSDTAEPEPGQFVEQRGQESQEPQESVDKHVIATEVADKQVTATEVIEVSDDDDREAEADNQIDAGNPRRPIWHYEDPQGVVQGPFSMESLQSWSDANYFPPDFKVWKTGQSQDEAVLLTRMLLQVHSSSLQSQLSIFNG